MASGNGIRGIRVGAGPTGEAERGEPVARRPVRYWCARGHQVTISFAAEAVPPETWECPRCGQPAGTDPQQPPDAPRTEPYKTHLAYVKERRSDADGEALVAEALAKLRSYRSDQERPGML